MKTKIIISVLALFALAGCWKEPAITPSTELEKVQYQLPQGTHDYDTRIVDFFEQTRTAMVYKFDTEDLYYTGGVELLHPLETKPRLDYEDYPDPLIANEVVTNGWTATQADEVYVGQQLDLIEELCFDFYTTDQLLKLLPPTVYLSNTWTWTQKGFYYPPGGVPATSFQNTPYVVLHSCRQGPGHIVFSWGGEQINSITLAQKILFKKSANYILLKQAFDKEVLTRADNFATISTYTSTAYGYAAAARQNNGILGMNYTEGVTNNRGGNEVVNITYNALPSPQIVDWDSYIAWIISSTEAEREAETGTVNFLHPSKDTTGKIRQKYDIVVAHMLTQGIDLVAIGNTPVTE